MTIGLPPLCIECLHFKVDMKYGFICDAFPDGIPDEIINNEFDHTEPFPGDNGIQFEPIESGTGDDE